jgi:hypothetical protein
MVSIFNISSGKTTKQQTPSLDSGLAMNSPLRRVFVQDLIKPSIRLEEDSSVPTLGTLLGEDDPTTTLETVLGPRSGQLVRPESLGRKWWPSLGRPTLTQTGGSLFLSTSILEQYRTTKPIPDALRVRPRASSSMMVSCIATTP